MPKSKSPKVQLWKQATQTDPPIQFIPYTLMSILYYVLPISIEKSRSPSVHKISHSGRFYFFLKINKCQSPKVQKSKSENRPLRLTHRYSYTIHTNEYFILGSILFHWKIPKSKCPPNLTQWEILFKKKMPMSKSPTLKTGYSDWPTYAVIPYVLLGCKLFLSSEKSQSPNVHQISHSGKFYFF